jgi:hypothetical protein
MKTLMAIEDGFSDGSSFNSIVDALRKSIDDLPGTLYSMETEQKIR